MHGQTSVGACLLHACKLFVGPVHVNPNRREVVNVPCCASGALVAEDNGCLPVLDKAIACGLGNGVADGWLAEM